MVKEYEIVFTENIPRLKVLHEYDFDENMKDPGMISLFFMECLKMDESDIEHLYVMAYNSDDNVIGIMKISDGDCTSADVDYKKIITFLILVGGTQFITCHNHPNGNSSPSQNDKFVNGAFKPFAMMHKLNYSGSIVIGAGEFSIMDGEEHIEL